MSNNLTQFHGADGQPILPRSARAYFDNDADITQEQRLLELGCALWLGFDLFSAVKDYLRSNPELERSFILSIARHIEFLRSNGKESLSFDALTQPFFLDDVKALKPMTLKEIVSLLSEELLLHYRFHHLKECLWNYKDIESRFDGKELINRLRSVTSVTDIPINESELLEQNPWSDVLNYERADYGVFYDSESRWLLKNDAYFINQFNSKNIGTDFEYKLNLRPEPFSGNPMTAKVVVLSLNPGYVERNNAVFAKLLNRIPSVSEVVKNHKDKQLQLRAAGMFCDERDAQCMLDDWYWYDVLTKLSAEAQVDSDVVFRNVAVVQYVGYFSKSYKALPANVTLPSQRFTRLLISYLATAKKDVLFVVSRSENEWRGLLGEEIWNLLESENRLIHRKQFTNKNGITQTIRTQGFTKDAFAADGFSRIVKTLQSL